MLPISQHDSACDREATGRDARKAPSGRLNTPSGPHPTLVWHIRMQVVVASSTMPAMPRVGDIVVLGVNIATASSHGSMRKLLALCLSCTTAFLKIKLLASDGLEI